MRTYGNVTETYSRYPRGTLPGQRFSPVAYGYIRYIIKPYNPVLTGWVAHGIIGRRGAIL
jgi:hypothetical protein